MSQPVPAATSHFTRVTRGAVAFLSGTGMGMLAGIVTTVALTRTLGIDGYGTLALALAIVTVAQVVSTLGLAGGSTRMLALARGENDEDRARRIFNASVLVGVAAAVVGIGLLLLLTALGVTEEMGVSSLIAVASPLLVAAALRSSLYASLRSYQDVKALFVTSVTVPLFDIAAVLILVLLGVDDLAWYAIALVGAAYCEVVLLYLFVRRKRPLGSLRATTRADAKALLTFSLPFILVQFMFLAIHQSDVVLLGAFHPASTVGLYTPVMRLGQTVEKLLSAFPLLYLPIATGLFAQKRLAEIRDLYLSVTKWAYAVAFTVILVIVVAPGTILPFLFGGAYAEMVTEARILAIGFWATLLTGLNGVTLGAFGLQKPAAAASLAAIAINIAVGLVLIPSFGAAGAAWSNTIAYVVVNGLFSLILYRHSGITPFRRDTTSLYAYSGIVAAAGLAAGEVLPLDSTAAGFVLAGVVVLVWLGGAALGRPFALDMGEMKEVFALKRKGAPAPVSAAERPHAPAEPRRASAAGATDVFPFIVGRGRSGTTLLRALFDSHPAIAIPPESPFVVSMARRRSLYERPSGFDGERFAADVVAHPRFGLWEVTPEQVRRTVTEASPSGFADAVRALYAMYAAARGKTLYADKSPRTSGAMPLLASLFGEARFVHLIRDGRDVALSHFDVDFGAGDLVQAAVDWRRQVAECRRAGRRLGPDRYREVRYEDLVDDVEGTIRGLCSFLGVVFDPAMLRYFERAEAVIASTPTPHAHRHLTAPPTKNLRDWRRQMAPRDVAVFELLAGDLLGDLGYELTRPKMSLARRAGARWAKLRLELPRRMRRFRPYDLHRRVLRRLGVVA